MSIAFIAPYENLHAIASDIIASHGYPAKSYLGDMEEGVAIAKTAIANGAKVIISRGKTARCIHNELGVAPIELNVSTHSILSFILEQTTPKTRIAVLGYKLFICKTEPICSALKREYACFESDDLTSSDGLLDRIAAWKPDIVLGDAASMRLARRLNLPYHLINSSESIIIEAFEQALFMLDSIHRHTNSLNKIYAVLDCVQEGALLVNNAGLIEAINKRGCALLNAQRAGLINTDIRTLIHSEEINTAVAAGKNKKNILFSRDGQTLAVSVVPTMPEKNNSGTVLLLQQVEDIQNTENSIRRKLYDKGFVAKFTFNDILYRSAVIGKVVSAARDYSATTSNILIQGETGTGKELFAQSIHNASSLRKGPFVPVNCATLSGSLLESELFGYAPGAFTGALRNGKMGLFELAHNGTLFLDEICEMDIYLQARLLRAIQSQEIMRVGDNKVIPVNVRIIAATNRNPGEEVAAGRMRADLFFRLNVLDLVIPPLRERNGDVEFLFSHYVTFYEAKMRRRVKRPSAPLLAKMESRSWPGNIRELQNLAEKYVSLDSGISLEDIQQNPWSSPKQKKTFSSDFLAGSLHDITGRIVRDILAEEKGNITKSAIRLGVDRNTVKRWLSKS